MCALINPATKTLFPARIIFMVDHGRGSGRIGSKVPPDGRDHCREPCSAQMPLVSALTFLGNHKGCPYVLRGRPPYSASLHAGIPLRSMRATGDPSALPTLCAPAMLPA